MASLATYDSGRVWKLERAHIVLFDPKARGFGVKKPFYFPVLPFELDETPADFTREERKPVEQGFHELLVEIRRLEERGIANTVPLRVELYLKLSFPFCILIFAVMGSAMGISGRRSGTAIGFGLALIITFLYYLLMSVCSSLGKTEVIDPFMSAWIHNVVFSGVAILCVLRAQR